MCCFTAHLVRVLRNITCDRHRVRRDAVIVNCQRIKLVGPPPVTCVLSLLVESIICARGGTQMRYNEIEKSEYHGG